MPIEWLRSRGRRSVIRRTNWASCTVFDEKLTELAAMTAMSAIKAQAAGSERRNNIARKATSAAVISAV
jgi:hypothetical protein